MRSRSWFAPQLMLLCALLPGCGFMLQRASVSRSFGARFGCQGAKVTRVGDGYQVQGCGQNAQYVCRRDYGHARGYGRRPSGDPAKAALGSLALAALFAGANERCYLAYAEPQSNPTLPVASAAPTPVRRTHRSGGEIVLKTRVLFAGGHLSARAKPSEHPEHALLVLHGNARLPAGACRAELYHDGVEVPILGQLRPSAYEVQLLSSPLRSPKQVARLQKSPFAFGAILALRGTQSSEATADSRCPGARCA